MRVLKICMVSLAFSLAGCAPKKEAPPPAPKTVFDPLTQQLDRARDVQKDADQNSDATRKAVDAQERGDSPQ